GQRAVERRAIHLALQVGAVSADIFGGRRHLRLSRAGRRTLSLRAKAPWPRYHSTAARATASWTEGGRLPGAPSLAGFDHESAGERRHRKSSMVRPVIVVLCLWAAWFASWLLVRDWSNPTVRRPAPGAQTLYSVVVDIGFVLMVAPVFRA